MVCHEEVLEAAKDIIKSKNVNEFTPNEIIKYMSNKNSDCEESTIRTHVISRCCKNVPEHHAVRYAYFERIGHGLYRLIK